MTLNISDRNKILKCTRTKSITDTNNLIKTSSVCYVRKYCYLKSNLTGMRKKLSTVEKKNASRIRYFLGVYFYVGLKRKSGVKKRTRIQNPEQEVWYGKMGLNRYRSDETALFCKVIYSKRIKRYEWKSLFEVDWKRFYREVNGKYTDEKGDIG